jgi:hypothetical protein
MIQTSHPVYDHNCPSCLFLGAKKVENTLYDFYFCPKDKANIARFGSDTPDYISLPAFLVRTFGHIEPYRTALQLASQAGK